MPRPAGAERCRSLSRRNAPRPVELRGGTAHAPGPGVAQARPHGRSPSARLYQGADHEPVRIARSLGFPVVCTLHDFFAACPNGAFYDYAAGKTCDRRPLSLGCAARHCDKRRYVHKLFRLVRGVIQRRVGRFPAAVLDYIPLSRKSAGLFGTLSSARCASASLGKRHRRRPVSAGRYRKQWGHCLCR